MRKTLLLHSAVLLPAVFVFWIAAYPETMRWMEGVSYFSTLPDFLRLQVRYPSGALKYAGAFLLQFYRWPVGGALLQTLFAWVVMACADVAVRRLGRGRMAWAAFVPVAVFVALQGGYRDLEGALIWCLCSVVAAAAVCSATRREVATSVGGGVRAVALPCLLLAAGMVSSLGCREFRVRERIHGVERMAEEGRWSDILTAAPPEVSAADPVLRRYALLALTETGRLAEEAFRYGITSADDMFFAGSADVIGCNFNALLAESLGLDNEAIHQSFQLNCLSTFGCSFRSLRRITDACLRQGYAELAEKYMRILMHTSCHGSWVRSRTGDLSRIMAEPVSVADDAVLTCARNARPLLTDMACLFHARPDNRKCGDMLLCGLLASRDLDGFAELFPRVAGGAYSPSEGLPRHYEEALLLLSRHNPEILTMFRINPLRTKEFERFVESMDADRRAQACAMYPDSFWAYMYGGR